MILFLMVQYLEGTGANGGNNEGRTKVIPRYIEATKLEELCDIMADKCDDNGESSWKQFRTAVECSPTADVRENVHGKWLFEDGIIARGKFPGENVHCSICGHSAPGKPWWECNLELTNFCPNCGAKMEGKR